MQTVKQLDWTWIGAALRESAMSAHDDVLPSLDIAYSFLLDNPECFTDSDEWPADMPTEPNIELIAAYFKGLD